MSSSPKVVFFSKGRTHLWDLFLSLGYLGLDGTFFSDVPKFRLKRFGLTHQKTFSLIPWCVPFAAMSKLLPKSKLSVQNDYQYIKTLDLITSKIITPCDLFIGMSGLSLKAAVTAKKKYGAQIWIERGSRHILDQKRILNSISPNQKNSLVPQWAIDRELASYEIADKIVVGSSHVAQSFFDFNVSKTKIFTNNYGVDLEHFPPTTQPHNQAPTLIFVGGWTYRKGCDLIAQIMKLEPQIKFIHLGNIGDCPFPNLPNMQTFGSVNQNKLTKYYAMADVMILPSREEGLSLVQAQALASGLPIVCSDKTGGADFRSKLGNPEFIKVVASGDLTGFRKAILEQIKLAQSLPEGLRDILGNRRNEFSWEYCAKNYLSEIEKSFSNHSMIKMKKTS
jgi:alpha-maltose-1-phosphate synthase